MGSQLGSHPAAIGQAWMQSTCPVPLMCVLRLDKGTSSRFLICILDSFRFIKSVFGYVQYVTYLLFCFVVIIMLYI